MAVHRNPGPLYHEQSGRRVQETRTTTAHPNPWPTRTENRRPPAYPSYYRRADSALSQPAAALPHRAAVLLLPAELAPGLSLPPFAAAAANAAVPAAGTPAAAGPGAGA